MQQSLSIGEASTMLSVSISTLRRWHGNGKLIPQFLTFGNHRRYLLAQILLITNPNKANEKRINIGYARVSSHDQKKYLITQETRLSEYCNEKFENHEIIKDLGSGLNYKKRGIKQLINLIC